MITTFPVDMTVPEKQNLQKPKMNETTVNGPQAEEPNLEESADKKLEEVEADSNVPQDEINEPAEAEEEMTNLKNNDEKLDSVKTKSHMNGDIGKHDDIEAEDEHNIDDNKSAAAQEVTDGTEQKLANGLGSESIEKVSEERVPNERKRAKSEDEEDEKTQKSPKKAKLEEDGNKIPKTEEKPSLESQHQATERLRAKDKRDIAGSATAKRTRLNLMVQDDELKPDTIEYYFSDVIDFIGDFYSMISMACVNKKAYTAATRSRLWALTFLIPCKTLRGHIGAISALSHGHSFIFSGAVDSKLKIWDFNSWKCLKTLNMNLSPAPNMPKASNNIRGQSSHMNSNGLQAEILDPVTAICATNEFVFIGMYSGRLSVQVIFKRKKSDSSRSVQRHQQPIYSIKVWQTANINRLYTASKDGRVIMWDVLTMNPLHEVANVHRSWLVSLEIMQTDPDDNDDQEMNWLFSAGEEGNIIVWQIEALRPTTVLKDVELIKADSAAEQTSNSMRPNQSHEERLSCMTVYKKHLYSAGWDCYIKMWDATQSFRLLRKIFIMPLAICTQLAVRLATNLPPHLVCSVREGQFELRSLTDLLLLQGSENAPFSQNFTSCFNSNPDNSQLIREPALEPKRLANGAKCSYYGKGKHLVDDLSYSEGYEDPHSGNITTILCLSDGRIITGSDDWTVKVWCVNERKMEALDRAASSQMHKDKQKLESSDKNENISPLKEENGASGIKKELTLPGSEKAPKP